MCAWTVEAGCDSSPGRASVRREGVASFFRRLAGCSLFGCAADLRRPRRKYLGGIVGRRTDFCDPVSVQLYTGADGLPDSGVHQLSEDDQGRVWIGTMGGLACLEDDRIRRWRPGTSHGVGHRLHGASLAREPEGKVIKGVGKEAQVIEVIKDNRYEEIKLYPDQEGGIKVGTSEGRFGRIEDDRFVVEKQGPVNCRVLLQIAKAPCGSVAMGQRLLCTITKMAISTRLTWPGWKPSLM